MKIYTKTGDEGDTGLFAGGRVGKDDPRIQAIGSVDELNAFLGAARCEPLSAELDQLLADLQHQLFALGAELATPEPEKHGTDYLDDSHIVSLEQTIDRFEATLPPLRAFILPGGSRSAAAIHVARSVCRRSERCLVALGRCDDRVARRPLVAYLNRLGDLLFVLARVANQQVGHADVLWEKPSRPS